MCKSFTLVEESEALITVDNYKTILRISRIMFHQIKTGAKMRFIENLEGLVKEAMEVNIDEFLGLVNAVVELQTNEHGHVGSLQITGRLVNLMPKGEAVIVGDVHGDLEGLLYILKASDFIERVKEGEHCLLVFLGDYGDRGINSPEVYYVVLKLKEAFPKNVVLMRGNHEGQTTFWLTPMTCQIIYTLSLAKTRPTLIPVCVNFSVVFITPCLLRKDISYCMVACRLELRRLTIWHMLMKSIHVNPILRRFCGVTHGKI
ncbi:MAG: metallophosphoesterase [Candidatus Bathyarchaeota archaeon]|nr:metallophosphoesterase [Candidatus Bathyarchaeota archaeon]